MDDEAWELVKAMTSADPARRLPLAQVLDRLKALADAENVNECERQPKRDGAGG